MILTIGNFNVKNVIFEGLVRACYQKKTFYLDLHLLESKIIGLSDKRFRNGSKNKNIVEKY